MVNLNNSIFIEKYEIIRHTKKGAVVFHSTFCYFPETILNIDNSNDCFIKKFSGIKAIIKQDKHYKVSIFEEIAINLEIDIIFSCLTPYYSSLVYSRFNGRVVQLLAGYVSEKWHNLTVPPQNQRSTDIFYRGSIQPYSIGLLGYEKASIGNDIKKYLPDLKLDVSSEWSDRIEGDDWLRVLSQSKSVLGVPSGSNLFDWIGSLEKKLNSSIVDKLGYNDQFSSLYNRFLHKYEGNVIYGQIAPRHFEAVATKTVQILYEGSYSNILQPMRHYFPLKRDFSNTEDLRKLLQDHIARQEMVDNAFNHIIMNEEYSFKAKTIDANLDSLPQK